MTRLFLLVVGCEINDFLRCNCLGVCFLPIGDRNTMVVGSMVLTAVSVAVAVVIAGRRCGHTNPGLTRPRHDDDVSVQHHLDSDLRDVIVLEPPERPPPDRFLLLVGGGGGVECKEVSLDFLPGVVRRIMDDNSSLLLDDDEKESK